MDCAKLRHDPVCKRSFTDLAINRGPKISKIEKYFTLRQSPLMICNQHGRHKLKPIQQQTNGRGNAIKLNLTQFPHCTIPSDNL